MGALRMREARRLAVVALVALAAGCAPHFERPELAVVAVELKDARLSEQHFRVRLRVSNPNDVELPVREIQCTLELGDQHFGDGHSAQAFTVPRRGTTEFEMLLTTDLATTFPRVLQLLREPAQPLTYRLLGRVDTELGFARSIPFDQHGTLH